MNSALAAEVHDSFSEPGAVPSRIGRFIVKQEIGRGSNGVVYSAIDPVLGRDVAIKAIPLSATYPGHADMESGFLQEAKIAAGLNHPSIVTVFDAGKTDSFAYIAMERLTGSDLHEWMAANKPMSTTSAAGLIARVADAVHFAHRRGLIHRDIKPSNIFLGRDMKPKVLDFGIALAQKAQAGPDEPRKLVGTPNYMSPEQALGRPLDARSDIFSIGAILYELVSGHRAFDGANVDEILTKVVKIDPPALQSWRPEVSPVLGEIVMRALAKEPANRYQTAAQLRNDLAAFAGRSVSSSSPGTSSSSQAGEPERESASPKSVKPGVAAVASTGVAIAALILTFVLWLVLGRSSSESPAEPAPPAAAQEAEPAAPLSSAPAPAASPTPAPRTAEAASEPAAATAGSAAPAAPRASSRAAKHAAAAVPAVDPAPAVEAAAAATGPGTLSLAIAPWGMIIVDGKEAGVSPPLTNLELAPGAHSIEVRNGQFPALSTVVQIEPGKTFQLRHRF
jgi:serine/threonine-protein kinase